MRDGKHISMPGKTVYFYVMVKKTINVKKYGNCKKYGNYNSRRRQPQSSHVVQHGGRYLLGLLSLPSTLLLRYIKVNIENFTPHVSGIKMKEF